MNARTVAAVTLGGIAGAAARWWVRGLWPESLDWWATLVVNVAGSAILGWLVAGDEGRWRLVTAFGGLGFCGSFTTFSAFSVIVAGYFEAGRPGAGLLYAAVSLALAIAAAVLAGWARPPAWRDSSAGGYVTTLGFVAIAGAATLLRVAASGWLNRRVLPLRHAGGEPRGFVRHRAARRRRGGDDMLILASGALGSLTTFSTLAVETVELWRRNRRRALGYTAASLVGGVAAAYLGAMAVSG